MTNLVLLILENKNKFTLDTDCIKILVDQIWQTLTKLVQNDTEIENKSMEKLKKSIAALLLNCKSKEELETMFNDLEESIKENSSAKNITYICRVLQEIAENGVSKNKTTEALEKYNIFGVHSKNILFHITKFLCAKQDLLSPEHLLKTKEILKAQTSIIQNIRIPIPSDMANDCLDFISQINIKNLKIDETTIPIFVDMHKLIAELMFVLITMRSDMTLNYLPTYVLIFKDLLMTISLYKSDRRADEQLNDSEIALMSDLAHKLEK